MTTWVQGLDLDSKAVLRTCCSQKLEEMIHHLQVWVGRGGAGHLPVEPLAFSWGCPQVQGGEPGEAARLLASL